MLVCQDQRHGTGCGARLPTGTVTCPQCGTSLRYALELHDPGIGIGPYRIVRDIGFGGFGAVYEAEDTRQPGRLVALKESFGAAHIQSYQGEFAVLCNLQHDHLPGYYDVFEANGNGYLVMELVPGQSLEDILERHKGAPLVEAQVLGYALQVCDALSYLHQQTPPIIHRDIKPANIRLTPDGLIKLVDFGLLKQGTDETRDSRAGLTPSYAPLEQYGSGVRTDPRSDIYSLGATLYHLFSGTCPLAASDRVAQTPDPLPSPQQYNPRLAPHIAQAVMQAMALDPAQRYPTAAAFKATLTQGNPPPAAPPAQTISMPAPLPTPTPSAAAAAHPTPNILVFTLLWTLASAIGFAVGWVLGGEVYNAVAGEVVATAVAGAVMGAVGGSTQWLVLRRWLPRAGWWVLASMVGLALGGAVGGVALAYDDMVIALLGMALGGALVGSAQWLVLRGWCPRASWWMLASMVGWMVSNMVGGLGIGLAYGLITGPVLALLLRGRRVP